MPSAPAVRCVRTSRYSSQMAWDDDEEWPELSDDPESVARRRAASIEIRNAKQRVLRWVYAGLGFLIVLVIFLATR
jgi:hypothetical protein